jgi:hypothetical protein
LLNARGNREGPDLVANLSSPGKSENGQVFAGFGLAAAGGVFSNVAGGVADGRFHVITMRFDEARSWIALRVDGVETHVGPVNTYLNSGSGDTALAVGGGPVLRYGEVVGVAEEMLGYVAEVIIASGTTGTPQEDAALATYLSRKYGLTY